MATITFETTADVLRYVSYVGFTQKPGYTSPLGAYASEHRFAANNRKLTSDEVSDIRNVITGKLVPKVLPVVVPTPVERPPSPRRAPTERPSSPRRAPVPQLPPNDGAFEEAANELTDRLSGIVDNPTPNTLNNIVGQYQEEIDELRTEFSAPAYIADIDKTLKKYGWNGSVFAGFKPESVTYLLSELEDLISY